MNSILKYTIRIWLTGALLTPIFILLFNLFPSEGASDFLFIYLIGAVVGLLWSIPSFFILIISTSLLSSMQLRKNALKSWLTIAGIVLVRLPFFVFDPQGSILDDNSFLNIIFMYVAVITTAIWLFHLKQSNKERTVIEY